MKMVIVMVILVLVVMMAIFALALAKAAAVKSPMEQMLEDAEQRRFIDAWMRQQKLGSGCIDHTSEGAFGQNVESANTTEKSKRGVDYPPILWLDGRAPERNGADKN